MKRNAGFTLLEILVVVTIITILATFVGLSVFREPARAKVAITRAQIATLSAALKLYQMRNGTLPTQEQGLQALVEKPQTPPVPSNWQEGGYLDSRQVPRDGWGHEYVYFCPGPRGEPFLVLSYGADGQPGGQGDNADITNEDQ